MSQAQPGPARPAEGAPGRQQLRVAVAWLLGCCAVVASVAWVPVMVAAAWALRPYGSAGIGVLQAPSHAAVDAARQQMWLIAIASFLVIVALTALAALVGRRAFRVAGSARALALLERGAVASLVGGLALWLAPFLLDVVDRHVSFPVALNALLASIALAGAVGSLILGGIAVRQVTAGPERGTPERRWRVAARMCLAVAPVIMLVWFAGISGAAQFIVGFYLHIVF